jgi:hypothetical protein
MSNTQGDAVLLLLHVQLAAAVAAIEGKVPELDVARLVGASAELGFALAKRGQPLDHQALPTPSTN